MPGNKKEKDPPLDMLKENAKELGCLYRVEEILRNRMYSLPEVFAALIEAIPSGWQYPELCQVRIVHDKNSYQSDNYRATAWTSTCNIQAGENTVGRLEISYRQKVPRRESGFFLASEIKLIQNIAERIGQTINQRRMEEALGQCPSVTGVRNNSTKRGRGEWGVILDLLQRTDPPLLIYVCRRMVNYLARSGIKGYEGFMQDVQASVAQRDGLGEDNSPAARQPLKDAVQTSEHLFQFAAKHISDHELTACLERWVQEDKVSMLVKAVDRIDAPLAEVIDSIVRYCRVTGGQDTLYSPTERWLKVSLIRRFLSDEPRYIQVAKKHVEVGAFNDLGQRIIYPPGSRGRLGGKSAGLFLAQQVLKKAPAGLPEFLPPKVPRTWYITTDNMLDFLYYNHLEDLNEEKYRDLTEIRIDYPNIVQLIKNSHFPPGTLKSMAAVLDDLGDRPLIVRSSSVLEDRLGAAFSGKYKSLFLANQGSKQERLEALADATAEIYASVFNPDSIQYRIERGLLDLHEEMGIMIEEVVGTRVGKYFFPVVAGVAFSNNEFRWSPRVNRGDGLVRLVLGLGTRAVDRLGDDFPILMAPGQPDLRVNPEPDEVKHYSPKKADVINLETGRFETLAISDLLRQYGNELPQAHQLVSVYRDGEVTSPSSFEIDYQNDDLVVTFEGLIARTSFIKRIDTILKHLQNEMGTPVDIEFAWDGVDLYLLQCRPQNIGGDQAPIPIPREIPERDIVFRADRFITSRVIPAVSYIVYVDPDQYAGLAALEELLRVGRAVGALNAILPRRQFILMGPGRWGCRGDVQLGVRVTYTDLNNTALLIEIARRQGNYLPELSFGTHFFQDLVEADIGYLPLYPEEAGTLFNETLLRRAANILPDILPEFTDLAEVVRVIDVSEYTHGKCLRILMNGELEEAVGYFCDPEAAAVRPEPPLQLDRYQPEDYSRWRLHMAEKIAAEIDPEHFGVKAMYIFGSVNNATAGPGSDIDLIVHFAGSKNQRTELLRWLEGWSLCLDEMNYLRTGYKGQGLLDVHLVTDRDVAQKSMFACKIDSVVDPARPLRLKVKAD